MIYESNGWFFSDDVVRKFGDNIFIPGVGLLTVLPANNYVRQHGRKLTSLGEADALCDCGNNLPALINGVACPSCFADTGRP